MCRLTPGQWFMHDGEFPCTVSLPSQRAAHQRLPSAASSRASARRLVVGRHPLAVAGTRRPDRRSAPRAIVAARLCAYATRRPGADSTDTPQGRVAPSATGAARRSRDHARCWWRPARQRATHGVVCVCWNPAATHTGCVHTRNLRVPGRVWSARLFTPIIVLNEYADFVGHLSLFDCGLYIFAKTGNQSGNLIFTTSYSQRFLQAS